MDSSISEPGTLVLLLPTLLVFVFSILPLERAIPLPTVSRSGQIVTVRSTFVIPPPTGLVSDFLPLEPLPGSRLPPPTVLGSFDTIRLIVAVGQIKLVPMYLFLKQAAGALLSMLVSEESVVF